MSFKIYFQIAIRLILLFSTGMSMSFFSSDLHRLFNDKISKNDYSAFIRDGYDWSGSHYWFFWLCFFLFILSLISFISSVVKLIEKEYNIKF